LHLRDGEDELLNDYRLRSIIKKYSDHITLPIVMTKTVQNEDESVTVEDEVVNSATALWARSKSEVTDEEYNEFYKHVAHDFEAPLTHIHTKVEGTNEYNALLFVPARAPFDLWDRTQRRGVKLYVRRVFIMDDSEQLLPPYLRFIRGVIDCSDLPLNISREILQNNKQIDNIRSGVVKKVLSALEQLAKNEGEKYETFWREFGRTFKEGVIDDFSNKTRVAKLLRFASTHDDNAIPKISLEDYVSRMKAGQEKIYYITAENFTAASHSPHLEIFRKKGIEVLLLSEQIDEWLVTHLTDFEGKPLQSVTKGELDLGDLADAEEKKQVEQIANEMKPLVERMKAALVDKVQDIRITGRLTQSPACLVADSHGMDSSLERLLKSAGQHIPSSKPIMEINPQHPIIKRILSETHEAKFKDWVLILFDQALLSEGGHLEDPAAFVQRVNEMLVNISLLAR
jgi:molecular chaperone HtpG